MYHKFRHDYYSKTYPRYESYSDVENKQDLVDLINTIYDNRSIDFENHLYEEPKGQINPNFSSHVLQVVSSNVVCGELCVAIKDIAKETVTDPVVICAITDKIDIDKIFGNQDQNKSGDNPVDEFDEQMILGYTGDEV